jgi:DnaK suppressor protein
MAVKTATAVKKVRELTEEEILKAPEKDYMNEAQLLFFKKMLLELRGQLLQNADGHRRAPARERGDHRPVGPRDAREEYTLELRTRDRSRKLLKKSESMRMIETDPTVGAKRPRADRVPRLIARPTATLFAEAAGTSRRVQKPYGINAQQVALP